MEYYSAIKKNEILPFAKTWMDLDGTMLSEISQTEKDKYHIISFICGTKTQYKQINKNTFIDTEINLVVARGGMVGKWVK